MMGQFVALSAGQDALLDIYTKSWPSEHSFESSPLFLPFLLHGFCHVLRALHARQVLSGPLVMSHGPNGNLSTAPQCAKIV